MPRRFRSLAHTQGVVLQWSPKNTHLRVIQCLSGLGTWSKELYSILANKHNLFLLQSLEITAESNEQEKDQVRNPARCAEGLLAGTATGR